MAFDVNYKKSVIRDLKNLDRAEAKRLVTRLERELKRDPDSGEPLKGKFAGLARMRIGDYRGVYTSTKGGVLILLVAHR